MIDKILLTLIITWFFTQLIKIIIYYIKEKRLSFNILFESGGMPSSHSACVTALTTSIYFLEGLSNLFYVTLSFAILVMYDARGVRLESSKHAAALNKINKNKILNEMVGHTLIQVIIGAIFGIIMSILIFTFL